MGRGVGEGESGVSGGEQKRLEVWCLTCVDCSRG